MQWTFTRRIILITDVLRGSQSRNPGDDNVENKHGQTQTTQKIKKYTKWLQWTFTNLLDNHVSTEVLTTRADYRGECPPPSKLTITVFKRQNNIKSRHQNQLPAPDARFVYQRLLWCSCRKIWKFKATQNMKSIYYPNNPKRVPKKTKEILALE